jgi:dihydrofolate reductase
MSTLTVDVFVSVDGWAGSDGLPGYFGYLGPELEQWIRDQWETPQTLLLGRTTYEMLAGLPEEARDEGWQRMADADKVVFSTTLTEASWPNTRLCADDVVEEVRAMKAGGDGWIRTAGSLSLARQLMNAGLVDRLRLVTFPLVAGEAGREAFFADMGSADLELAGHQVLDGRILVLEYHTTGRDIPRA